MTQLSLSLDSKESAEVIDLISRAKIGEEEAGNKLFEMYKDAICGESILRKLNYRVLPGTTEGEEAKSILNEIFMMAIESYNSKKAKFITHLTNMIKWNFRHILRRERLVSIKRNFSAKKMEELLSGSSVIFDSFASDIRTNLDKIVIFNIGGQEFNMPESVFISKFVVDRLKEIVPISRRKIYTYYLKCVMAGEKNAKKMTEAKYKLKNQQFNFILKVCSNAINKSLKLKWIKYGD